MNASPEVKDVLLVNKMNRWLSIIQNPCLSRNHTTTEARRNFLKLVRRHKLLAAAHRFSEEAAFDDRR
jgi:hypothetical protein